MEYDSDLNPKEATSFNVFWYFKLLTPFIQWFMFTVVKMTEKTVS